MQPYYVTVLDALPLWGFFLIIVAVVLLSIEGGTRLGRFRRSRSDGEKEAPVGAMVGSTLGLLAFMLAFTFGMAAARYDTRKQLVLDEANAILTTYLRAGMLPDRREDVRSLLRTYVDARLEAVQSGKTAEGLRRSDELQGRLWAHAVAVGEQHPDSIVVGLFIQSLNDVIDLHAKRVTAGIRNRIPGPIWAVLFLLAILSLGTMGYHAGLTGTSRSFAVVTVSIAFSSVIVLIADLDRPQQGVLTVSQQALVDARQSMTGPGQ
jgi:hypothetical protein